MVQGGRGSEVETSYEDLRIGLPGSDRVLNFCGFLLQQPAVSRHTERVFEFREEMALAHVRLACSLLDGITVSEVVGHECREVLPCIEEGSEEACDLRLVGGCFEEHVQLLLDADVEAWRIQQRQVLEFFQQSPGEAEYGDIVLPGRFADVYFAQDVAGSQDDTV